MASVPVDALPQELPVPRPRLKVLDIGIFVAAPVAYLALEASVFPPCSPLRQFVSFLLLMSGPWCALRGVRRGRWYALGTVLGVCALRLAPLVPQGLTALRALVY